MSRYEISLDYVCRILCNDGYVYRLGPLKVAVCEESFFVTFHLPLYPFIKRFLVRYRLVPAQIHSNS